MVELDMPARTGSLYDGMVDTRRALHRRPELAFAERSTTAVIRGRLDGLGLARRQGSLPTGAVAVLEGGRPGRTVLLRADIDALPVTELTGLPFASEVDGVMHACGHDAHTAVLLGLAEAMSTVADDLPGRYVFVFQPAEEQLRGARAMLDDGLLDGLPVDAVLGWHVSAALPAGVAKIRPGVAMSEAQVVRVTFTGAGGHAARGGPNVLSAMARALGSLGSVLSGLEHDGSSCIATAGMVRGGRAANVVPTEATIEGSLRTFTEEQAAEALARLRELAADAAAEAGVDGGVEVTAHAPAVRNAPDVTALVTETAHTLFGPERVVVGPPLPPSDDVSELLARVPGCYFHVGGRREDGRGGDHHSPHFDLEESAMRTAAALVGEAATRLAARPANST
jgi:amidohydrolase